jgi:hypothetical protein
VRKELVLKFAAAIEGVDATCVALPAKAEEERAIPIDATSTDLIRELFIIAMTSMF